METHGKKKAQRQKKCLSVSFLDEYRGSPPYADIGTHKLCKISVTGTAGGPLLMQKSPFCTYISHKS